MTGLVMAKARLRRDVPAVAFAALLVPTGTDQHVGASHRLLWSLYADTPDRPRDFLWRQTRAGEFLMLGPRAPVDTHGLFELEHKEFAPELRPGQQLAFSLRANATVSRPTARGQRGVRHDVVMDALHALPPGGRAEQRAQITDVAVAAWLQRQGERAGFDLVPGSLCVESYQQMRIPRLPRQRPIQLGVVDCSGVLTVRDPDVFVAALARGFGRGRAFGCGLLLVRRVS
jgi:CRISPR system Cascade subunit CasE